MSKEKDPLEREEQGLLAWLNGGIGLLSWRLVMLGLASIGSIFAALIYAEGRNLGNSFIAASPSMVANQEAIKEAQDAVVAAKATADTANNKADQTLAMSSKIFDAIKELRDDTQATKVSIASSQATITAQVQDLGSRLSRIEAKQDAGK
jgi:hypothetical protein